ncbi:hypothetical protein DFH11DRAFT_1514222 [Phellopilus nigrolimitatus]|nr:hypothetical protein DFH11DRAFT_1514222 [Phellopilus nigrolimitatus]
MSTVESLAGSAAIAFTNLVLPTPSPPIVIASVFWTAEARTFIVRVESEFTVACTVVHPVRRLRFFRLLLSWIHARLARIGTSVRTEKSKNKPANTEIELDDFSDVRGLVARPPLQEDLRQEHQPKPQQEHQEETRQKQQRSSKRNSGWIGVFAGGESENGKASPSFAIDGTNDRLVVPEMDIGVAYFARHEEEDDEISSLKSFCLTID